MSHSRPPVNTGIDVRIARLQAEEAEIRRKLTDPGISAAESSMLLTRLEQLPRVYASEKIKDDKPRLSIAPPPDDDRPVIVYRELQYHDHVDDAEEALAHAYSKIYTRANTLVEISGDARLSEVGRYRLRQLLNRHIAWRSMVQDPATGQWVPQPIVCPMLIADSILQMPGWSAPEIGGIIRAPSFRPDGTLIDVPGFDPPTGLYYLPDDLQHRALTERPTAEQAKAALDALTDPVAEFPFIDETSRMAWVAYVLTCVNRSAVDGPAPFFIADAAAKRTGKGKLIDIGGLIAHGTEPASAGYQPENEEEVEKVISTKLTAAAPVVHFDNVDRPFGNSHLERLATSRVFSWRILSTQREGRARNQTVWTASGNNFRVSGDMGPRSLFFRLVSPLVDPSARTDFKHPNIRAHVLANRAKLIRAALTILRYGYQHPPTEQRRALGSFEDWCTMIRDPLYAVSGVDVVEAQRPQADDSNTEVAIVAVLLASVWVTRRSAEWVINRKSALEPGVLNDPALEGVQSAISQLYPEWSVEKAAMPLGKRLAKYVDRPIQLDYEPTPEEWHAARRTWGDEIPETPQRWREVVRLVKAPSPHGRNGSIWRIVPADP